MTGKPKAKAKVKEIELTAVGLDYRLPSHLMEKLEANLPLMAELVREPDNEFDENAIAVYLREVPFKDVKVGYISRGVAAELGPRMDKGKFTPREAWASELSVAKGNSKSPGHTLSLLVKV